MMLKPFLLLLLVLALHSSSSTVAAHADQHYHDTDGDGESQHDPAYDQEQFLGKDLSKKFAQFDSAASEEKLAELVKNDIDANKDGFVTEDELVQRLEKVHKQQQAEDLDTHWRDLGLAADTGRLNWTAYAKTLQPNFFDLRTDPVAMAAAEAVELAGKGAQTFDIPFPVKGTEDEREPLMEFFKELVRQRKRWTAADLNKDGLLSRDEYRNLIFPEESPAMQEALLSETLDQLDTDGDGRLSQGEYLAGQWSPSKPGEKEPHWLEEEREGFRKKDANGDGQLDRDEVRAWLQPPEIHHSNSLREEARHLVRETDDDRDGRLSVTEMAKHRELFAGSKATRYGEDIMQATEGHDEL